MEKLRVLVLEEGPIGCKVYVAQALEQDMATQVAKGDTLLDVIEALGQMFDINDQLRLEHPDAQPLPEAPVAYHNAWESRSFAIGTMQLGLARTADVRLLRDGYAIAILGRKRPEVVTTK